MATQISRVMAFQASFRRVLSGMTSPAKIMRFAALLLLVAQLGVVAHRIEHYIAPEHMECGEDACDAFAPTPDTAPPILFVPPVFAVVFFLVFWTVRPAAMRPAGSRLGFQAHAPPV